MTTCHIIYVCICHVLSRHLVLNVKYFVQPLETFSEHHMTKVTVSQKEFRAGISLKSYFLDVKKRTTKKYLPAKYFARRT